MLAVRQVVSNGAVTGRKKLKAIIVRGTLR
jgi:aldehyde:ferredoxin oxidoreductase